MERAGLRALLFSDIEGSTPLLQRLGPRYAELIAIHDALIRAAQGYAVAMRQSEVAEAAD